MIPEVKTIRSNFIPPIVGATIPRHMTFRERVFWYSTWIQLNPHSHIHFVDEDEMTLFISERHFPL